MIKSISIFKQNNLSIVSNVEKEIKGTKESEESKVNNPAHPPDNIGNITVGKHRHKRVQRLNKKSDNLCIGTTSPTHLLTVAGDLNVTVELTSRPYDTRVLGVISTTPNIIFTIGGFSSFGGDNITVTNTTAPITIAGRVPTKVTDENSPIQKGDLLTTSSTKGHAMKCEIKDVRIADTFEELKEISYQNDLCKNAVIGKALEPLTEKQGKIMALITLQ